MPRPAAGTDAMGVVAVAVAAALAGCAAGRPAPPPAQPAAQAPPPAPQPTRSAAQQPRPATQATGATGWIQQFDCVSTDAMKQGQSLRAWSGGPEGATWNWYGSDLVCTVVVQAECEGKGRAVLKLGRRSAPAARGTIALSRRKTTTLALRVRAATWKRALERRKDATYQKLTLAVQVTARCASGGPARRWSDSFVGGFAGGE